MAATQGNGGVVSPGYTQGLLSGIAYDSANQTLYFTTWDDIDAFDLPSNVTNVYAAAVPAAGQQITLPAPLYASTALGPLDSQSPSATFDPSNIEVDAGTGQLFIFNSHTAQTIFFPQETVSEGGSIDLGTIGGAALSPIFTPFQVVNEVILQDFTLDVAAVVTAATSRVKS